MELAITPAAMTKILDVGFDKEYGARPLRRAITSVVDDTLSEALLRGVIAEGDTAVIDFDPDADARVGVEDEGNSHFGVSVLGVAGDPRGGRPNGVVVVRSGFRGGRREHLQTGRRRGEVKRRVAGTRPGERRRGVRHGWRIMLQGTSGDG